MNLIKKELIEEAYGAPNPSNDFLAGVEFAESQLEELAVEFAEWLFSGEAYDDSTESRKAAENSFQQFIKEIND